MNTNFNQLVKTPEALAGLGNAIATTMLRQHSALLQDDGARLGLVFKLGAEAAALTVRGPSETITLKSGQLNIPALITPDGNLHLVATQTIRDKLHNGTYAQSDLEQMLKAGMRKDSVVVQPLHIALMPSELNKIQNDASYVLDVVRDRIYNHQVKRTVQVSDPANLTSASRKTLALLRASRLGDVAHGALYEKAISAVLQNNPRSNNDGKAIMEDCGLIFLAGKLYASSRPEDIEYLQRRNRKLAFLVFVCTWSCARLDVDVPPCGWVGQHAIGESGVEPCRTWALELAESFGVEVRSTPKITRETTPLTLTHFLIDCVLTTYAHDENRPDSQGVRVWATNNIYGDRVLMQIKDVDFGSDRVPGSSPADKKKFCAYALFLATSTIEEVAKAQLNYRPSLRARLDRQLDRQRERLDAEFERAIDEPSPHAAVRVAITRSLPADHTRDLPKHKFKDVAHDIYQTLRESKQPIFSFSATVQMTMRAPGAGTFNVLHPAGEPMSVYLDSYARVAKLPRDAIYVTDDTVTNMALIDVKIRGLGGAPKKQARADQQAKSKPAAVLAPAALIYDKGLLDSVTTCDAELSELCEEAYRSEADRVFAYAFLRFYFRAVGDDADEASTLSLLHAKEKSGPKTYLARVVGPNLRIKSGALIGPARLEPRVRNAAASADAYVLGLARTCPKPVDASTPAPSNPPSPPSSVSNADIIDLPPTAQAITAAPASVNVIAVRSAATAPSATQGIVPPSPPSSRNIPPPAGPAGLPLSPKPPSPQNMPSPPTMPSLPVAGPEQSGRPELVPPKPVCCPTSPVGPAPLLPPPDAPEESAPDCVTAATKDDTNSSTDPSGDEASHRMGDGKHIPVADLSSVTYSYYSDGTEFGDRRKFFPKASKWRARFFALSLIGKVASAAVGLAGYKHFSLVPYAAATVCFAAFLKMRCSGSAKVGLSHFVLSIDDRQLMRRNCDVRAAAHNSSVLTADPVRASISITKSAYRQGDMKPHETYTEKFTTPDSNIVENCLKISAGNTLEQVAAAHKAMVVRAGNDVSVNVTAFERAEAAAKANRIALHIAGYTASLSSDLNEYRPPLSL